MRTARLTTDPLWQCICPAWSQATPSRGFHSFAQRKRPSLRCLQDGSQQQRTKSSLHSEDGQVKDALSDHANGGPRVTFVKEASSKIAEATHKREHARHWHTVYREANEALRKEPTPYLYTRLRTLAYGGKVKPCRELAEYIVRGRREKPNAALYNALILSNVSHDEGAAWRVLEYLEEMREAGLQPDTGTCHAVLKVTAVHPDHLLRADTLEYMRTRWYQLTDDGLHDVAAGLLREGLFEQALHRIDDMQRSGKEVQGWLLDMTVYMLCAAGEIEQAYRLTRSRYDAGELNMSRSLWYSLLDAASSYRHHATSALIWNTQVNPGYLNPSSGICLAVLNTAAQAGDAVLATDVFSHLSKRGTAFTPIHYQLLIDCYLAADPPDLKRALSILTIMAPEKMADPSPAETRSLYLHLRSNPFLTREAFTVLRELREEKRHVPIAALNLVVECYVEQKNLTEALNVYKLMHTFAPPTPAGTKKTFANIETFNLLLRGCRLANPPDEARASFLVSELLALRVKPTALTYDRLILVFVQAGAHAIDTSERRVAAASVEDEASKVQAQAQRKKGLELLDWASRHFADMQAVSDTSSSSNASQTAVSLGWMPRFGTVERLATQLARVGDTRCWDVLQAGEDHGGEVVDGWEAKGQWVRRNVERAWAEAVSAEHNGRSGNVVKADRGAKGSGVGMLGGMDEGDIGMRSERRVRAGASG